MNSLYLRPLEAVYHKFNFSCYITLETRNKRWFGDPQVSLIFYFTLLQRLHTELADSTVTIQETLLLKLLQFAGIKDKSQLWGENTTEEQDSSENLPAFVTSTRYYVEKLQVDPFKVVVTCNPASKLSDELQCLKTALEIPAGFPPLMENANVQFGN